MMTLFYPQKYPLDLGGGVAYFQTNQWMCFFLNRPRKDVDDCFLLLLSRWFFEFFKPMTWCFSRCFGFVVGLQMECRIGDWVNWLGMYGGIERYLRLNTG